MTTEEAIEFFGSRKAIAFALGVWPQTVDRWKKYPPISQQYHLYYKSGEKLLPEGLKNDKTSV
jgi:hypothetical protein